MLPGTPPGAPGPCLCFSILQLGKPAGEFAAAGPHPIWHTSAAALHDPRRARSWCVYNTGQEKCAASGAERSAELPAGRACISPWRIGGGRRRRPCHPQAVRAAQGAALAPPCATCRTCHRLSPSIWRLRKKSRRPTACAASASLSAALDQTKRNALPHSRCSKKQRRQLAQRYRAKALRAALFVAEAKEAPELEAPLNIPLALSASDLDLTWGAKRQQLHTTRSRCARTVRRAT